MMLIRELKSWLSAFADDEEVAIDDGGLTLETRTEDLAVGGWPDDSEELTCILTAENMHTADDCTTHDHEAFTAKQPAGYRYENIASSLPLVSEIKSPKDGDRAKSYTGVIVVFKCGQWSYG